MNATIRKLLLTAFMASQKKRSSSFNHFALTISHQQNYKLGKTTVNS